MRKLLLALVLALAPSLAAAQSVTNNAIVVGAGTGKVGFKTVGPCATNQVPMWAGGSGAAPTCQNVSSALGSLISPTAPITASFAAGVWTVGLTTPLATEFGGTGIASPTANRLLTTNGSSAMNLMAAMTNGQLVIGQTGAAPSPQTMGGDATIGATGTLTIANNVVTNAKLATVTPATIKGNPTNGTVNITDFTIQGLASPGAINAVNDKLVMYHAVADDLRGVNMTELGSAIVAVNSLNALTGNLNIVAGAGINVSAGAGTITVTNTGGAGTGCTSPSATIAYCGGAGNANALSNNVAVGPAGTLAAVAFVTHANDGTQNTAMGYLAGTSITSGYGNSLYGVATGFRITVGGGAVPTVGSFNSFFGYHSGFGNTSGAYNAGHGLFALQWVSTGSENTAIGATACLSCTTPVGNVAVGANALGGNYDDSAGPTGTPITGGSNTIGGYNAAIGATTASQNSCWGAESCGAVNNAMFSAQNNSALGWSALQNATSAESNVATGVMAGINISTGSYNILSGRAAGKGITTGTYNIIIGSNTAATDASATLANATVVGSRVDLATIADDTVVLATGQGTKRLIIAAGLAQIPGYGAGDTAYFDGSGNLLTRSLSGLLDTACTAQGSVLYRGAATWTCLAPGTANFVLTSGGAGANVSWAAAGSGTVTNIATAGLATGGAITTTGTITVTASNKADMEAAISTSTAVTPTATQYHDGVSKAWAYCSNSAGTYTLAANYNISGSTCGKTGTGQLTLGFSTAFASANYACSASTAGGGTIIMIGGAVRSATQISVDIRDLTNTNVDASFNVTCFGRQ